MTSSPESLMSRLKSATSDLHSHAESRHLQRQIAAGTVDRSAFSAYLAQLYLVHHTLEPALARVRERHPAFAAVATADRMRLPDLEADLDFHEVDLAAIEPVPATVRLTAALVELEIREPAALLGSLYVLEGSTNGGRFLARVLRQAWGLDGRGLRSLDPYGERQRERWADFKRDMDALTLDTRERNAVVDAARSMFEGIAEISDQVAERSRAG